MESNGLDFDDMEFTYFGDLLGTSNWYSIDKDIAYEKLDTFYNGVWKYFRDMADRQTKKEVEIFIFSDSLFITGAKLKTTIEKLAELYHELFIHQIFLRGAIVKGLLKYDPRMELRNLVKRLPRSDVLYRSVTLEKSVKGARLLIEKTLAKKIIPKKWLTDEQYSRNVDKPPLCKGDFRRRIVLHREWRAYEYLWTWPLEPQTKFPRGWSDPVELINSPNSALTRLSKRVPKAVSQHYEETRELFYIAAHRKSITEEALGI